MIIDGDFSSWCTIRIPIDIPKKSDLCTVVENCLERHPDNLARSSGRLEHGLIWKGPGHRLEGVPKQEGTGSPSVPVCTIKVTDKYECVAHVVFYGPTYSNAIGVMVDKAKEVVRDWMAWLDKMVFIRMETVTMLWPELCGLFERVDKHEDQLDRIAEIAGE